MERGAHTGAGLLKFLQTLVADLRLSQCGLPTHHSITQSGRASAAPALGTWDHFGSQQAMHSKWHTRPYNQNTQQSRLKAEWEYIEYKNKEYGAYFNTKQITQAMSDGMSSEEATQYAKNCETSERYKDVQEEWLVHMWAVEAMHLQCDGFFSAQATNT